MAEASLRGYTYVAIHSGLKWLSGLPGPVGFHRESPCPTTGFLFCLAIQARLSMVINPVDVNDNIRVYTFVHNSTFNIFPIK